MTTRCTGSVWVDSRMGHAPCSNRATRDGFCGIHHPDAVAKRRAKSDQHYAAQRVRDDVKWASVRRNAAKAELFGELVAALEAWDSDHRLRGNLMMATAAKMRAVLAKAKALS